MSSSSTLPPQPFRKNVNLKILYTFDDTNTFLARSAKSVAAKIITLPSEPPHNGAQIGCVELKKCLELLYSISPEWFQKGMDYSIYYKDIVEIGEPYVASGLCSRIIKNKRSNLLITGRLCKNVINLYENNSFADTLDIKLRLSPINTSSLTKSTTDNDHCNPANSKRKQMDLFSLYAESNIVNSNPLVTSDSIQEQEQQPTRKRTRKSPATKGNDTNNHSNLKNNQPQLAIRTQSLPFITEDSLAHKIRISDMRASKVDEEIDVNGQPISSRFSNFQKANKQLDDSQPTRARKSKSFIQSVVKIGDNAVNSKNKKNNLTLNKRCVNCTLTTNPPYKFHKDGIFELANSGYLCSTCTFYHSENNIKGLRERGELGSKGLLEGPYSSKSKSTSANLTVKRPKKRTNPNTSLSMENSSSPLLSSSPMNLQTGFVSSRSKRHNHLYPNLIQKHQPIQEVNNFSNNDLLELLKLESTFANYKIPSTSNAPGHNNNLNINISDRNHTNQQSMGFTQLDDMFTIPEHRFAMTGIPQSSSSSLRGNSKNNTPNESNDDELCGDFDNIPVDATKLNTTLIPMDDDDKENYPPSNINTDGNMPLANDIYDRNDNINNDNAAKTLFPGTGISPSIQRIIESFSNEPSSPTKSAANDWNYEFFDYNSSLNGTTNNSNTECDDPEINRILGQTDKYEVTPRDPGTSQTQQNGDNDGDLGNGCGKIQGGTPNSYKALSAANAIINMDDIPMMAEQNNQEIRQDSNNTNFEKENNKLSDKKQENLKKEGLIMPSSPFFNIHNDDIDRDDKTLDTTNSLMNWEAKSSPVTDPFTSETK